MLHCTTLHILVSTSLLFYITFGYQFLSSLYPKGSLSDSCLANSLVIPEWVFFYVLGMFQQFKSYAWREIIHEDGSLLWKHNTLTCHFNIMNNITLVFCTIYVTIHFSQKRHAYAANGSPDLHTFWRFDSSLDTLSMIFLILFEPNTTMASIIMTVKYRLM